MKAIKINHKKKFAWLMVDNQFLVYLDRAARHMQSDGQSAIALLGEILVAETHNQGKLTKPEISRLILAEVSLSNIMTVNTTEEKAAMLLVCVIASRLEEVFSPDAIEYSNSVLLAIDEAENQ